jgi:hypothetical protein
MQRAHRANTISGKTYDNSKMNMVVEIAPIEVRQHSTITKGIASISDVLSAELDMNEHV